MTRLVVIAACFLASVAVGFYEEFDVLMPADTVDPRGPKGGKR